MRKDMAPELTNDGTQNLAVMSLDPDLSSLLCTRYVFNPGRDIELSMISSAPSLVQIEPWAAGVGPICPRPIRMVVRIRILDTMVH